MAPELRRRGGWEWIEAACAEIGRMRSAVQTAIDADTERERHNVVVANPVTITRTGRRGRPKKVISKAWLEETFAPYRSITIQQAANALGVHWTTVSRYMRKYDISISYAPLSDEQVDQLVRAFKVERPNAGIRHVHSYFRTQWLRIQRQRIIDSLHRVDAIGAALRHKKAVARRVYSVPRPNHLWHIDGHHKLIRWGIVFHGGIDGCDDEVVMMRAANNNRPETVLIRFDEAVQIHGLPLRVRGDRGGENILVSSYMIMRRGPNRASFMFGSSTRNQKIERIWVDVGEGFVRRWRVFFTRLEGMHGLDAGNPAHLWLLHELFLSDIDTDADNWVQNWNLHKLSGKHRNQTPSDIRHLAKVTVGMYEDEYADIDPDILTEYLGVEGAPRGRRRGQTGAGHSNDTDDEDEPLEGDLDSDAEASDEEVDVGGAWADESGSEESVADSDGREEGSTGPEDEDDSSSIPSEGGTSLAEPGGDNLVAQIIANQASNIRHAAIKVARHKNPFESQEDEDAFWVTLDSVTDTGFVPRHMNIREEEWEQDGYPTHENLVVGKRKPPLRQGEQLIGEWLIKLIGERLIELVWF
ncbi:hypothetical protein EVJ58_g5126 [Rhodofomes roseus]|uniref:Integrase core domain-containing protein n=1 Tax=Rhodofomes roseus TaxID=34475 RepID=A0A4Y9YD62_9APHY|nr:hypothetical protein EVJ58_g5126 [Rhodofomes roseus]